MASCCNSLGRSSQGPLASRSAYLGPYTSHHKIMYGRTPSRWVYYPIQALAYSQDKYSVVANLSGRQQ